MSTNLLLKVSVGLVLTVFFVAMGKHSDWYYTDLCNPTD